MNITKIKIVRDQHGPDRVFVETDLPEATWPYNGKLTLRFDAAYGSGVEFVRQNFHMDAELITYG